MNGVKGKVNAGFLSDMYRIKKVYRLEWEENLSSAGGGVFGNIKKRNCMHIYIYMYRCKTTFSPFDLMAIVVHLLSEFQSGKNGEREREREREINK